MAVIRHRALLLFLVCLFFTSICVVFLPSQRSRNEALQKIVLETHQKLSNVIQSADLKGEKSSLLSADPSYLALLGLAPPDDDGLPPAPDHPPHPPLVSAVAPGQAELAVGWLRSAQHWLAADISLTLWDLGLGRYERELVSKQCNATSQLCTLVQFEWSKWPSHVRDSKLHCHRPIIIQSTLRELGSLIWLDIDHRLTRGDLGTWLAQAETSGVLAWPVTGSNLATTALTHPKMFNYFDRRKYEDYAFQHMVSLGTAIIVTSERIQTRLMLPWLQCVLTEDTGCRFDKKPMFRYSGCHRYDVSAFNIVLGEVFSFNEAAYMGTETFFRKVDQYARDRPHVTSNSTGSSRTPSSAESLADNLEMR